MTTNLPRLTSSCIVVVLPHASVERKHFWKVMQQDSDC